MVGVIMRRHFGGHFGGLIGSREGVVLRCAPPFSDAGSLRCAAIRPSAARCARTTTA
ncbi:hypothetical protein WCLP8_1680003 [uncultured Gammaproteobacteria bacterium]